MEETTSTKNGGVTSKSCPGNRETLSGLPRMARRGRSQNQGKPAGGDHHPGRVSDKRDFERRSRVFGGNLDERSEREGSTGNCRHFGLLTSAH